MKRVIFAIALCFNCTLISLAEMDRFGSERAPVWRSSFTRSADLDVTITSRPVIFWDIIIGTPAANSSIVIYNSSDVWDGQSSTVTILATDKADVRNPFSVLLSSGLTYNKIGTAQINIIWDYFGSPSR